MNKDGFLRALFKSCAEHDWFDVDSADLQEMMVRHGFLVERPATEEDCQTSWAQEWGLEVGDSHIASTDEMKAFMNKPEEEQT